MPSPPSCRASRRTGTFLTTLLLTVGMGQSRVDAVDTSDQAATPNLVQNPSFEHNWFNRAFAGRRRFLLLQGSDLGVGEQDGHIDHWRFKGVAVPDSWDTTVAHSGTRSVKFTGAGSGTHLVRFAGEQYWRDGGSAYNKFLAMEQGLAAQVARRPIVVGAWCKMDGVAPGSEPQLKVMVEFATRAGYETLTAAKAGKVDALVAFSAGTHDWEYRQVRIEPPELTGTPYYVTIAITSRGSSGTVWFDDVSCSEEPAVEQINRVANAGFEALDDDGWAAGWQRPAHWDWFRQTYYAFTGWSHSQRKTWRGEAFIDRLLSCSGSSCLRFNVFPGDNFAVQSVPIELNQDKPRPLELRAIVKADNLRTLEIMAQDESGQWLPQGDFLGADMEEPGSYNMGTTGAGTYDWMQVRKYFSPRKGVKSVRLFLCARGFDGALVKKNLVGTVWFDDIQLFEHGVTRGEIKAGSIPAQAKPALALYPFRIVDVSLGDRLWGKNAIQVRAELKEEGAIQVAQGATVRVQLTDPAGTSKETSAKMTVLQPPAAGKRTGYAVATVAFVVDKLCSSWKEQYKLSLCIDSSQPGHPAATADFYFGTPAELLSSGVSAFYAYPQEAVVAFGNLNVANDSFADLARCDVVVKSGGEERTVLTVNDFSGMRRPQRAPDYIDTRDLIQASMGSDGFTVHPWAEPVLDNTVMIRLHDKSGAKPIAETEPVSFGFMKPVPKMDVPENKSVDLTPIVYSRKTMPDDEVKAQLVTKINQIKNDPKLFAYELGEGEMQLQGQGWKERLEWLKRAIPWIREADPNHVINGPGSWLVGHPGHNAAMVQFIPHFDVIGVETSFEYQPKINELAKPLMKERKTAVLVGLETYFYQTNRTLRWRGYRSVFEGANGVGLCPSGMMQSRPDKVNYLRGLNGEFRGLAPVIVADEPGEKLRVHSKLVDTMERVFDGRRYLVAIRNRDDAGPQRIGFQFPNNEPYSRVKVRCEGRTIQPDAHGFEDEFASEQTVHVYELER